ncbi:hypothetical protein [Nannocystis punicea]|uniref:Roadblock/LAMTOR2 domain-containing protein n=1 Tax=Nannocystis punicea TaxID=2995304 RepID=A0ABY7GZW8_9BACT|nr:hypothetical protein [Nannocystis poenicansa]WAS92549.1 hypothetical protein O0S08_40735 [Nannocystis poenicansa]
MNIKELHHTLADMEDSMLGGLAAIDVFAKTSGMSVAGLRTSPRACALFNILFDRISDTLKKTGLPVPENVHQTMLRLGEDGQVMIIVVDLSDKYRMGMALDCTRAQLGIMVSVVLPEAIPRMRAALL